MAPKLPGSKRKLVEIDLTGDSSTDDEAPAHWVQEAAANLNAARRAALTVIKCCKTSDAASYERPGTKQ